MKTMEKIDGMKLDAEKSCGLEVEMDDPIFKELQSAIVEEEDILIQLKRLANDFIAGVSIFVKKDPHELSHNMKVMLNSRGSDVQKSNNDIDEYVNNTCNETSDTGSWAIVETQDCVFNLIEKRFAEHQITRNKFWKLKKLRGNMAKLKKIAAIDNKSKLDLPDVMKEVVTIEKELVDELLMKKDYGVGDIHALCLEFFRIEQEYFTKMNDAYVNEHSTPSPRAVTINKSSISIPWVRSPVIGGSDDENSELQIN